jgi:Fe-S-cluster containining protein
VATTKRRKLFIPRSRIRGSKTPCDYCTGKCCRYFSLPIDTPTTWDDYDSIRWYLAHQKTMVYVEKGTWYLVVMSKCDNLLPQNRCAIYHDRPKICREYTTDECEYDQDWSFEKVFETQEQIWEYAEAVLPARRQKKPAKSASLSLVVLQ